MHSSNISTNTLKNNKHTPISKNEGFRMLHLKVYDSKSLAIKDKIRQQIKMLNQADEELILDVIEKNADLDG